MRDGKNPNKAMTSPKITEQKKDNSATEMVGHRPTNRKRRLLRPLASAGETVSQNQI